MWPSSARPEHGSFVRDQVEALRRQPDVEVEVRKFPPGASSYLRAAWALRGAARRGQFDVVHAHYGLSGWSALAARARQLVVTFHGTDLRHRLVGPMSRLLARLVALPAAVSGVAGAQRAFRGAGTRRRVAVLPCGVDLGRFRPLDRARGSLAGSGSTPTAPTSSSPPTRSERSSATTAPARCATAFRQAELLSLTGVAPERGPALGQRLQRRAGHIGSRGIRARGAGSARMRRAGALDAGRHRAARARRPRRRALRALRRGAAG